MGITIGALLTSLWWLCCQMPRGVWDFIQDGKIEQLDFFELPIFAFYSLFIPWCGVLLVWLVFVKGEMLPTALGFVVGRFERFLDWISEDWEEGKETFQEIRAEVREGKNDWEHWFALLLLLLWAGIFVLSLFGELQDLFN